MTEAHLSQVPAPPADILGTTRKSWNELWNSKLAGSFVDTDLPTLRRLYSLIDERERAYRAVKDKGRMVEGSQKQLVINPLLKQMSVYDTEIRQLEDRFGLSPASRLRLGITFNNYQQSLKEMNASLDADLSEAEDPRDLLPPANRRAKDGGVV